MAPAARASASKTPPFGTSKAKTSTKKTSTLKLGKVSAAGIAAKKALVKPITQFVKPTSLGSASNGGTPAPTTRHEDKGKQKEVLPDIEDQLWVDQYEPLVEGDLAVHKRKVEDVRRWLVEALDGGKLRKYRRILTLTGPAGSGKTATLKILAKELDVEIVEWRNGVDDSFQGDFLDYESLSLKFQNFLDRASSYRSLSFTLGTPSSSSQANFTSQASGKPRRQLILIEDLPNILHSATREAFQSALTAFATSAEPPSCPLVIVISDTGVRGESKDERGGHSAGFGGSGQDEAVDVRSVIPHGILGGPYCTQIPFNPIATTIMRKAVNSLLTRVASSPSATSHQKPSKEVVDIIVESANGDIRSAIMALQFACIVDLPGSKGAGRAKGLREGKGVKGILEAITQREQSLLLFHLLGKLLYNKRYGDPEEEEDAPYHLMQLPKHLRKQHERRLSKVDANVLYAESPVDTSLVSLYVHQNYTQFCETVEECDGIMANLSDVDGLCNSDLWPLNAALLPHSFHTLALGTLHSLPSPVTRRRQKTYKPDFFESLSRGREAENAVVDARAWLDSLLGVEGASDSSAGVWSKRMVVLEAPGLLKARKNAGNAARPPPNHVTFSTFDTDDGGATSVKHGPRVAEEDDTGEADLLALEEEDVQEYAGRAVQNNAENGWLSDDEIDDV
ncbi:Cell cycle checkpoint protein rad17 [Tulasnella sp. JGI-2019a]|nr:Cell cycle checkpoint protein rad17 [Tulasnella sp. JGI-2019a]